MNKKNLNEDLNRIKELLNGNQTTNKIVNNQEINDIVSLYEKFNIKLDDKTISILSNGTINEQKLGEKISDAFANLKTKFRNAFQNKWAKKQGLPTPKQLMENDQKKSPAVVNHSAYRDTITLMYRKKIRNGNAILYWYYGEGFTGGKTEGPENKQSAEKLISIMKQLETLGTFKSDGFKNFVKELESLFAQGIYVSLDVMSETVGEFTGLSKLLQNQEKIAFVLWGTKWVKLTSDLISKYGLSSVQGSEGNYYVGLRSEGGTTSSARYSVRYQNNKPEISPEEAKGAGVVDENIFNSLAFELKTLAAEGEVAVGLKFTDQDKLSILDYVEQSASQAGDKILNATTFDLQAENIGVDKSGIIQDLETIKEGETVVFAFQYPDKNDLNALKTTIYNVDDGIVIPPEGIEKIKGAVQDAINSVTANGFKITGFGRYAGSTTSRVGTAYGKEDNGTTEENNVTLATDRCGAMNAQVDIIVESLLPGIVIETTENIVKPNQGPGWYSSKGVAVNGPLYQKWSTSLQILLSRLDEANDRYFLNDYRTDSAFAPKFFYVYRSSKTFPNLKGCPWTKEGLKSIITKYKSFKSNTDLYKTIIEQAQKALSTYQYPTQQQVQDEYESVYAQYRGSWITFGIKGTKDVVIPPEQNTIKDIQVSAHGDWVCSITFPEEREPEEEKEKVKIRINIKWPKLKFKKVFKFKNLGGVPFVNTVKTFCEDAYD
jgi:hypothetical protein